MWQRTYSKFGFTRNLIALVFAVVLVACETKISEPTITNLPGSIPSLDSTTQPNIIATNIVLSDTPLVVPSETLSFAPVLENTTTVYLPLPSGKPISSWKGVPIMPDAIAGEEKEGGYSYTTKATAEQVQDFYNTEMPKIGWKFFTTGKGETGSLLQMYQRDEKTSTVSIFEQGGLTLVLLIQY